MRPRLVLSPVAAVVRRAEFRALVELERPKPRVERGVRVCLVCWGWCFSGTCRCSFEPVMA